MGKGLGRALSSYIDTQVAVWIALGNLDKLSAAAGTHMAGASLLISPVVVLELEYLYEIGRFTLRAHDIVRKLRREINLRVCELPFIEVVEAGIDERWTRDPFDRLIVAQAKANGFASLITADRNIRKNYPRAVW
jgi:PIN domain nuclease of toxin-antitoxin system